MPYKTTSPSTICAQSYREGYYTGIKHPITNVWITNVDNTRLWILYQNKYLPTDLGDKIKRTAKQHHKTVDFRTLVRWRKQTQNNSHQNNSTITGSNVSRRLNKTKVWNRLLSHGVFSSLHMLYCRHFIVKVKTNTVSYSLPAFNPKIKYTLNLTDTLTIRNVYVMIFFSLSFHYKIFISWWLKPKLNIKYVNTSFHLKCVHLYQFIYFSLLCHSFMFCYVFLISFVVIRICFHLIIYSCLSFFHVCHSLLFSDSLQLLSFFHVWHFFMFIIHSCLSFILDYHSIMFVILSCLSFILVYHSFMFVILSCLSFVYYFLTLFNCCLYFMFVILLMVSFFRYSLPSIADAKRVLVLQPDEGKTQKGDATKGCVLRHAKKRAGENVPKAEIYQ